MAGGRYQRTSKLPSSFHITVSEHLTLILMPKIFIALGGETPGIGETP